MDGVRRTAPVEVFIPSRLLAFWTAIFLSRKYCMSTEWEGPIEVNTNDMKSPSSNIIEQHEPHTHCK